MPAIGWIFLIIAAGMVLGSLLLLRDSAHTMPLSKKRLKKIHQRQAQLEAEERKAKNKAENKENRP